MQVLQNANVVVRETDRYLPRFYVLRTYLIENSPVRLGCYQTVSDRAVNTYRQVGALVSCSRCDGNCFRPGRQLFPGGAAAQTYCFNSTSNSSMFVFKNDPYFQQ